MLLSGILLVLITKFIPVASFPEGNPSFASSKKRNVQSTDSRVLVDLKYEVYNGIANSTSGLNIFKGIRYAAAPTGLFRWQAPQPPVSNRVKVLDASSFAAICPQSVNSGRSGATFPSPISEDCLFLNVYAPQNASNLPVLVHIHGGGYGTGDSRDDLTRLINANQNTFVAVSIQYRLGAFGFLASDELFRKGVVNAGLLDQQFALQWVQEHIKSFGGNPRNVTIFGISAGGGSVMVHDMAYGGTQGTSLFTNSISFSPYLPQQYNYNDWVPSQAYYAFATQVGCAPSWANGNASQTIFQCIVSKDTKTLQAASNAVSSSGIFGTWAFLPVTDGILIESSPSEGLVGTKVNGLNHLSSNTAEESFPFVSQNINTKDQLHDWIRLVFPLFNGTDIDNLLLQYPAKEPLNQVRHATSGDMGATALEVSATASGYQQLANLIYAESTFVCSSYWLAEAYNTDGKKGYKAQYSIPLALHGYDGVAAFGNLRLQNQGADFVKGIQIVIGSFVKSGNPSISKDVAGDQSSDLGNWPVFTPPSYPMVDLNQTGGQLVPVNSTLDPSINRLNARWYVDPGLQNKFSTIDGFLWEGGRGKRCNFWRDIAGKVPMR